MKYEESKAILGALNTIPEELSTVAEVERFVGLLEQLGDYDDESSHSCEDEIHRAVLLAIALGHAESPAMLAVAALKTKAIKFQRWCA